jgi:hypothetical protein
MLCRAPGPIKLSSQSSTARVRLSLAFRQTQRHVEKRRAKPVFAEPNWHVLTLFFIQFSFAVPPCEYLWSCSNNHNALNGGP